MLKTQICVTRPKCVKKSPTGWVFRQLLLLKYFLSVNRAVVPIDVVLPYSFHIEVSFETRYYHHRVIPHFITSNAHNRQASAWRSWIHDAKSLNTWTRWPKVSRRDGLWYQLNTYVKEFFCLPCGNTVEPSFLFLYSDSVYYCTATYESYWHFSCCLMFTVEGHAYS